jgi:hypothetical protein
VLNTEVIYWGTLTNWTEIIPLHAKWRFWQDPLFEDLEGRWKGQSYDDSFWQGPAPALLAATNFSTSDIIDTRLPYVGPTYYFRTTFIMPDNFVPDGVLLSLALAYKCGVVCYVNGAELARFGMFGGPVDFRTQASGAGCIPSSGSPISFTRATIAVTNLVRGTNVFAAEVHQPEPNIIPLWPGALPDLVFGAQVLANIQTRTLPPLSISRQDATVVLSWPISTIALESAPNPTGPWAPLAINTNFFGLPVSVPMNYFRLRSW